MESSEIKQFVGCDVSKATLDFALHIPKVKDVNFPHLVVTNDKDGFKQMLAWLKTMRIAKESVLVAMEHTGIYSECLCDWLAQQGILFVLLNPMVLKTPLKIRRGKNDQLDSQRLAEYAYTYREQLEPSKPVEPVFRELRALRVERRRAVKARTALKNQIHSLPPKSKSVKRIERVIKEIDRQIKEIEQDMIEIINSDDRIQKSFKLITSIKGIGLINAVSFIISTLNFSRFKTARQFATFVCVAPFAESSGTSVNKTARVSKKGDHLLKAELTEAAKAAIRYDAELHEYYNRRRLEGKSHGSVMNAVKFKLVLRVFAVIKRDSPFIDTHKYRKTS